MAMVSKTSRSSTWKNVLDPGRDRAAGVGVGAVDLGEERG
jgi:hypothetical protein